MPTSAGIIFVCGDKLLLTKRGDDAPDHAGEWAFPGGKIEAGETPEQAAVREIKEELGIEVKENLTELGERDGFCAYRIDVPEPFAPVLNFESSGYVWCSPESVPMPVHPDAQSLINEYILGPRGQIRTELAAAKAIMAGDLPSPYQYGNTILFAMRITGTGLAYRTGEQEYVWRDPSLYLNDEFLQRCSGLPVIIEHPKSGMLDSTEFESRSAGSILLPYFKDQEVWGIAKLYNDEAILRMLASQQSTSPAVIFRKSDGNETVSMGGEPLLIEGKPSLLDHLAICQQGVWDKGGEPAGVDISAIGESTMDQPVIKPDDAAPVAAPQEGDALSQILAKLGGIESRLAALETAEVEEVKQQAAKPDDNMPAPQLPPAGVAPVKPDSVEPPPIVGAPATGEPKADTAAKPAEEMKELTAKADAATAQVSALQAQLAAQAAQIASLTRAMPKALSDEDYASMASAQARADSVMAAFGDSAPRPLQGEDVLAYRRRLASKLQGHSKAWGKVDIGKLDGGAFDVAEGQIYADAQAAAMAPSDLPAGQLREIHRKDPRTGGMRTEFAGDPKAFIGAFTSPSVKSGGIPRLN